MKVKLIRAFEDDSVTLGMMKIEGVKHQPIFTLENPQRHTDLDSRIPAGTYKCSPYSGTKYKDVYIVQSVPNRTAILIHWGNFEKDTLGCILVGFKAGLAGGKPAVLDSMLAMNKLRELIGDNEFTLEIV